MKNHAVEAWLLGLCLFLLLGWTCTAIRVVELRYQIDQCRAINKAVSTEKGHTTINIRVQEAHEVQPVVKAILPALDGMGLR